MKWIGSKVEQFVTRFYGDLYVNNAITVSNGINYTGTPTVYIDSNQVGADATTAGTALHVDFYRVIPPSGSTAHIDRGIDLDVRSASLGVSSVYGMDIDVVGNTGGTSTAYGIHLDVDSADTNIGMEINTAGTHLKLTANADKDDYATMSVADTGDLTIQTVGDGTTDSDIAITADGKITLTPANITGTTFHLDANADSGNIVDIDAGILDIDVRGVTTLDTRSLTITNAGTSGATTGGIISLVSNDGSELAENDRLGVVEFSGAENDEDTIVLGASIEAYADALWSPDENGTRLVFSTTDGNANTDPALTLDSNKLATFTGGVTIDGDLTVTGAITTSRQLTHHMIKDNIAQVEHFIGLQEADAETATISNKNLPLLAPVAGKLLKIFLRTEEDMSGSGHDTNLTWRLLTRASSATTGGNAAVIGTQTGAGPTASSMATYDFTSSLDSGTNVIAAGDKVQLSVQSDAASEDMLFFITCLWEWDFS